MTEIHKLTRILEKKNVCDIQKSNSKMFHTVMNFIVLFYLILCRLLIRTLASRQQFMNYSGLHVYFILIPSAIKSIEERCAVYTGVHQMVNCRGISLNRQQASLEPHVH